MDRGPARSGIRGLRPRSGDLIEDIHRQQRRRVLKRAAQLVALGLVLLLAGVAFKSVADRRARAAALETARTHALAGGRADLALAAADLDASLQQDPEHGPTLAARALVAAIEVLEFGGDAGAVAPLSASVPEDEPAAPLVAAFVALVQGDLAAARAASATASTADLDGMFADYVAYLQGWLAVADAAENPEGIDRAIVIVEEALETAPTHVALRRLLARLLVYADRADEALPQLDRARDLARTHMGLAADEALYNAHLRREPGGVASVADQLLASGDPALGPRDVAHARLARAVVHIHSGERDEGLRQLEEAWPDLAAWDALNRRLCVVTALEGGAGEQAVAWAEEANLPASEVAIYTAWSVLLSGDVMKALAQLAELDQAHPRVAYLQARALVEQGRYAEAMPWIERTERLLPGRVEIEVVRARAELHTGDKVVALRKLDSLAKEEPYAPGAWTGLGQALLLQDEPQLRAAEKAFQTAVEREAVPAEALRGLARVWQRRAEQRPDPDAEDKALQLLDKAAAANPKLPTYAEDLGRYLADMAYESRALERLRPLADHPATRGGTLLRLAQLEVDAGTTDEADIEALLAVAAERGVADAELDLVRARRALASGAPAEVAAAQARLAKRLEVVPDDIEARRLHVETYLQQRDRKAAELAVRRGLQAVSEDRKGRLLLSWAQVEAKLGKRKVAAPRSRSAWVRLLDERRPPRELLDAAKLTTDLWLRQGKERIAFTIAERLTERLSHHAEAWTILANAQLQGGETALATKSAARAIELDESLASAHEVLGHAQLRFGQRKLAQASYERAIALAKGTRDEGAYDGNLERL